ncbi:hypothetical protein [Halorhodospira sp. 9622]|uniref:hypothetical protein n=1 Tax=Halorhodospira sp. 9622 TaxID=2899136 RepID=UPI001EE9506C|nr:hypothetical protein [Halorhodospira sp. 9622]MCG5538945.1 hypothetical protein [Halorhodospira sp. 9622]
MARFLIAENPQIDWSVKAAVPVDGGRVETHRFEATFRRLTADELEQLRNEELDIAQVLRTHVLGWSAMHVPEVTSLWWPIEYQEPSSGGGRATQRFQARLQPLTASELEELDTLDIPSLLRGHVLDWSEVFDAEGNALPFSADALEQALQLIPVRGALASALFDASNGVGKQRANKADHARSEPVAFSEQALEWALEQIPVRTALFNALVEVSSGGGARKNSRSSRAR